MEFTIFLKGIFIGFVMAVPLGPIGIMCIRKTLTEGQLHGIIIGLGAATADMIYGSVAAFGITIVSDTLISQKIWIRIIGGVLLLFLGIRIYRSQPSDPKFHIPGRGIFQSYLTTVFLTLTNPLAIFAFIAVFAALGLGNGLGNFSASTLVAGVFIGSCLWFLLLSFSVKLFRKKFSIAGLRWVNRIAGVLIVVSGLAAFGSLL